MENAIEVRRSVCPLDCPDRCSLEVEVLDGRVRSIRGSSLHELTAGFICSKVGRFHRRLYGPDRIHHPLRRSGPKGSGKFEEISWDEAVDEIASELRRVRDRHGPESILPFFYGGSNGMLTQGLVDEHFFRRLGASRLGRTVCAASTTAASEALYGKMPGTAFEDYPNSRFILIWGANPRHSNIHLVPPLKEARAAGARIAVVDPHRILGDDLVDFRLQPFPGTDVVVALAMIRHLNRSGLADHGFLEKHATGCQELFDCADRYTLEEAASIARVNPSDIARVAEAYAASDPAVLRCGWGLERNRNGLASVAAVIALPAVAGKFGRRGGGYTLSNSGAIRLDEERLAGAPEPPTRRINMNRLGRHLLDGAEPRIRALFVYNANPAVTLPDQNGVLRGMRREDLFTVVFDQVFTDTAALADVVLPATTFLEHEELSKSYGAYALQLAEPVIDPVGESLPNAEVFRRLGRAMGWNDGLFAEDGEALLERALSALNGPLENGNRQETLRSRGILRLDFPGPHPVQFESVFPRTPDRRIRLYPSLLGPEPYRYLEDPGTPEYPLALISPASNRTISSTLAEFNLPVARLEMHPEDAASRGLGDDSRVRVFNALGEVQCGLRINAGLRPGVVSLPKGIWRRSTLNGSVGNALVPDDLTPVSGGACFNDARVQVERLSAAPDGRSG